MRMIDAAEVVLKDLSRPATPKEICAEIQKRDLFKFNTKSPVSVLSGSMRRRTKGSKTLRGEALFTVDQGRYALIPKPDRGSD